MTPRRVNEVPLTQLKHEPKDGRCISEPTLEARVTGLEYRMNNPDPDAFQKRLKSHGVIFGSSLAANLEFEGVVFQDSLLLRALDDASRKDDRRLSDLEELTNSFSTPFAKREWVEQLSDKNSFYFFLAIVALCVGLVLVSWWFEFHQHPLVGFPISCHTGDTVTWNGSKWVCLPQITLKLNPPEPISASAKIDDGNVVPPQKIAPIVPVIGIHFDKDCWFSVDAKGAYFQKTVTAGYSQEIRANNPVTIRSGCPGYVTYTVDGQEVHPRNRANPKKAELVTLP